MSYASVNDMVIRFGEAELLRLSMTPTGELDQAAITIALQDAGALIDGYLAGRIPCRWPISRVPWYLSAPILPGTVSMVNRHRSR